MSYCLYKENWLKRNRNKLIDVASENFRFLDENGYYKKKPEMNPFGMGKRTCLGENLARYELFLVFTTLLQKYEFRPIEGEPLPSLERSEGMTNVPRKYRCTVIPRSEEEVASPSSAAVSSRNPQWMSRVFRRVDGARITSYFSVRKRAREDEAKDCCKRARRGLTVCDVKFISPAEACNGMNPLFLHYVEFQNECCAIGHSSVSGRVVPRIPTPLGAFGELPSNLLHLLFDNLEVSCLIALCLTSTAWSTYALDYVYSHSFLRRAQRESTRFTENGARSSFKYFTPSDPFYCYGTLKL
ncbi:unnamed protein product [Angiostrongylus costaricensis]|uniref:Cytochrome P450 n=1 Tax=Angiostrongylus costaricensis TaxID=334426 RepID=A0A158PL95_ANGCS|nr:unnamed protein product [Angiostrongylus costaricensis]